MNQTHKSTRREYEFTRDWFSRKEALWARHFSQLALKPTNALEVGSLEGRSAIWTLENLLLHSESMLTCIDLFPNSEIEARFDRNIELSGRSASVTKLKGSSWEQLRSLPVDAFDFIYVDGSHHGRDVMEDAVLSFRLLKISGFLVFDDYPWDSNRSHSVFPKDAIDPFLKLYADHLRLLHLDWQVIVQKV